MESKRNKKARLIAVLVLAAIVVYLSAGGSGLLAGSPPGRPPQFPPDAQIATDIYVQVDGVSGESVDYDHQDWIEAMWIDYGFSQPGGIDSTSGASSESRAEFTEFTIGKVLDRSSPMLYVHCCNGRYIPTVTVELCRAGGEKQTYMKYTMTDVLVSSIGPVTVGTAKQLEQVSFRFGRIKWEYWPTDREGREGAPIVKEWDLTTNKER